LTPDAGVIKVNRTFNEKTVARLNSQATVAFCHLNPLGNPQNLSLTVQRKDSSLGNRFDKGARTAVENRHFTVCDIEDGVIYAAAVERRKDMFNGCNHYASSHQRRRIADMCDVFGNGRDFKAIEVRASENITGVCRSRAQGEFNVLSGMKANAANRNSTAKCRLVLHGKIKSLSRTTHCC
jgi:hypothetical protein